VSAPTHRRPRLRLDAASYKTLCQIVLKRDGWRCQNCGNPADLQVHHICSRSSLGSDVEENLITLCATCHRQIHLHKTARP
jgi:5-methylcytosine-specific restriction endonuclease McrA